MRLTAVVVALAIALLSLAAPTRASAAPGDAAGDCTWNGFSYDCTTQITEPGSGGTKDTNKPTDGLTPGATTCSLDGAKAPCSTKAGWFVNSADCSGYVELADAQPAPPPGQVVGGGAWYTCTLACQVLQPDDPLCIQAGILSLDYWSTTPPPGVQRYTPAQAAGVLAQRFQLRAITIGMAPERKVHDDDPAGTAPYRRTWVGIPVWLWVKDPEPLTYGPYEQTATLGGVTITARAAVSRVDWRSTDGQQVSCGAGTVFDATDWADRAAEPSPTCGLTFARTSNQQADGGWRVTAVSHWAVSWTGGGESGTIQLANLTATTAVRVGELQSVNVPLTTALVNGR